MVLTPLIRTHQPTLTHPFMLLPHLAMAMRMYPSVLTRVPQWSTAPCNTVQWLISKVTVHSTLRDSQLNTPVWIWQKKNFSGQFLPVEMFPTIIYLLILWFCALLEHLFCLKLNGIGSKPQTDWRIRSTIMKTAIQAGRVHFSHVG